MCWEILAVSTVSVEPFSDRLFDQPRNKLCLLFCFVTVFNSRQSSRMFEVSSFSISVGPHLHSSVTKSECFRLLFFRYRSTHQTKQNIKTYHHLSKLIETALNTSNRPTNRTSVRINRHISSQLMHQARHQSHRSTINDCD